MGIIHVHIYIERERASLTSWSRLFPFQRCFFFYSRIICIHMYTVYIRMSVQLSFSRWASWQKPPLHWDIIGFHGDEINNMGCFLLNMRDLHLFFMAIRMGQMIINVAYVQTKPCKTSDGVVLSCHTNMLEEPANVYGMAPGFDIPLLFL